MLEISMRVMPSVRKQLFRDVRRAWQLLFGPRQMIMPVLDYDRYWSLQQADIGSNPTERDLLFGWLIEDGSSVLDVGCGTGRLLSFLQTSKPGVRCRGLDVSQTAVDVARGRGCSVEVADVSAADFQLDESFDFIIISEVLEHLPNAEQVLLKLKGHFRKALLVSIPNVGYYPHRLRLLVGSFPVQTRWHPAEHLRYWTVYDFKQWTRNLGFRIARVQASNGFPILASAWPNLFGHLIVFELVAEADREPATEPSNESTAGTIRDVED